MNKKSKVVSKDIIKLKKLFANSIPCGIQDNGRPCNACFHTWAMTELDLNEDIAHMLWLVELSLRKNYKQEDILKANIDNFKEWARKYEPEGYHD